MSGRVSRRFVMPLALLTLTLVGCSSAQPSAPTVAQAAQAVTATPAASPTTAAPAATAAPTADSAPAAAPNDDDVQPAPPSIGADVPVTYFGPAPSSVDPRLVGPVQLLKSGTIDFDAATIELPLYEGRLADGRSVWYILTDTSDKAASESLGINFSGKLAYATTGAAARSATLEENAVLVFDKGSVDFSPVLRVVPGAAPNFFPPQEFQPGSVGDADYTPLVRLSNVAGTPIYNAPVIAFNVTADQISFCDGSPDYSLVHDKVVQICPNGNGGGTVTIALTVGFSFAKPVLYLSTEANDPLPAAMETATFAPGLKDITKGRDDSFASPSERLFAVVNGPTGLDNPQRQGFFSALGDAGAKGPINLLGGIPFVATDYSPLWDLNVGAWTQEAIDKGYRSRMIDEFQYLGMVQRGFITAPDGGEFGSSGFIVNCPVVHRFL
jgi:hypothetical protein